MAEVAAYPRPHYLENSFHRLLAPILETQTPAVPQSSRVMTYNTGGGGYYALPTGPAKQQQQQQETRSSSVSSASSLSSYTAPYNSDTSRHADISRTISPASGVSDPGTGSSGICSRNYYQPAPAQEPFYTSQSQSPWLPPFPSQILQSQAVSSPPICPPVLPLRFHQPSPYGGFPVGPQCRQPSPLIFDNHAAHMFPSSATTPYHSSPARPEYQTSTIISHAPLVNTQETPKKVLRLDDLLKRLPANIIQDIRKKVTWFHCWKFYELNDWLFQNFHPDSFTYEEKLEGMLYAEQNWGRYGCKDSDVPNPRRSDGKLPPWFGCYHCFQKLSPNLFERYRHCNPSSREEERDSAPPAGSKQSYTPPPKTSSPAPLANPHYDPSLTRSNLRATAVYNGRRASPETGGRVEPQETNLDLRLKKTWGLRRFCIYCGLKLGVYGPGDLIEVHNPETNGQAWWVCGCLVLRQRPKETHCRDCGQHVPLSSQVVPLPGGRR